MPWDRAPASHWPRRGVAVGGAVAVFVALIIVFAWVRFDRPTDEVPVAIESAPSTTFDQSINEVALPSPELGPLIAEADLRSVDGSDSVDASQLWVVAVVEEFVTAYFSTVAVDAIDRPHGEGLSAPTYAEWVSVTAVSTKPDGWEVRIRVGLLEVGDVNRRHSAQEYLVDVRRVGTEVTVQLPVLVDPALEVRVASQLSSELPEEVAQQALARADTGDAVIDGWETTDGWHVVVAREVGPPVVVRVSP